MANLVEQVVAHELGRQLSLEEAAGELRVPDDVVGVERRVFEAAAVVLAQVGGEV